MNRIPLSNESIDRLAGLQASDSPFANTIAAAIDNVAAGITPESSLASAIEAAAGLDSNAALNREAGASARDFLAKLAESAGNVAGSMNGATLRDSEVTSANALAAELDRLARGTAAIDWPETYAALCQIGAQGVALLRTLESSRTAHATCAASLARAESRLATHINAAEMSQADATQLRGSPFPAARTAARYLAAYTAGGDATNLNCAVDALLELERQACEKAGQLRAADENAHAYKAQRDKESARAVAAERLAESRLAEAAEFRGKHCDAEARAEAAERQLAEYRSLMSALPAGLALRDPGALALLRAYLADAESAK